MSRQEKEVRKRKQKENIEEIILSLVSIAGLLTFAVVAPNAVQILDKLGVLKKLSSRKSSVTRTRSRLIQEGLVTIEVTNKGKFLRITEKGKKRLDHWRLSKYKFHIPKKWDKKYRVVIFDVKEGRKSTRDKIRRTLQNVGFYRLQDSVWVLPYDCEDFVALLKADSKIGKDVQYMIVDSIENDRALRDFFALPQK